MNDKITPQVREQAERVAASGSGEGVPVIVTFVSGTDPKTLEERGLDVRQVWKSISAASGRLAPEKLSDLAALEEVRLIEYDGEVHAL